MLGLQHNDIFQALSPGGRSLPRDILHKINADVLKSLQTGPLVAFQEVLKDVNPAEAMKLLIVRGLKADGEAVDAGAEVGCEFIAERRGGIHLDRDLRVVPEMIVLPDRLEKRFDKMRVQHGGRSPADKDAGYLIV